jgi:aryl-alcohol dehydrogenase-like predicted oxidoreductase
VSSAIVGTAKVGHLQEAIGWAEKGALDAETVARWQSCFAEKDAGWTGQI